MLVNQDSWNLLPDDLKVIVEQVCKAEFSTIGLMRFVNDQVYMVKAVEEGVTIHHWSSEDYNKFIKAWTVSMEELGASGDPYCAELLKVVKETRIFLDAWPE